LTARINASDFIRPHIRKVEGYKAVDPIEEQAARMGIPEAQVIRLNANENPYGCSPKVAAAVAAVPYNIYPDPEQRRTRRELGKFLGVSPDSVIAGAGSDEIIDLLFRLVLAPGDNIIDCDPTFGMYSFDAGVNEVQVKTVQRDELFDVDVAAVKRAIDSRSKAIFLTSPNNPTGNVLSEKTLREILDTGLLVAVDEAYYDFCGKSFIHMVSETPNLVVLRTMSKWAGLAGLRVGYGVMHPDFVSRIIQIKQPYNISTAAEAGLYASIEDAAYLDRNRDLLIVERERLFALLKSVPGITPLPSGGNFILFEVPQGRSQHIFDSLAKRGIFLRRYGSKRLVNYIRTSVGKPEHTDALISALKELV